MQGHYTGSSTVGEEFQCNSQWIKENTWFMQVSLDFTKPISTWEVNRGNCQDKQCCAASWLDLAHSKEDKEQVEACNQDYPLPYTHRAITYTSILYLWSKCSCPPAHYWNFLLVSNPTYASCSNLVKPKLLTFLPFFFVGLWIMSQSALWNYCQSPQPPALTNTGLRNGLFSLWDYGHSNSASSFRGHPLKTTNAVTWVCCVELN